MWNHSCTTSQKYFEFFSWALRQRKKWQIQNEHRVTFWKKYQSETSSSSSLYPLPLSGMSDCGVLLTGRALFGTVAARLVSNQHVIINPRSLTRCWKSQRCIQSQNAASESSHNQRSVWRHVIEISSTLANPVTQRFLQSHDSCWESDVQGSEGADVKLTDLRRRIRRQVSSCLQELDIT